MTKEEIKQEVLHTTKHTASPTRAPRTSTLESTEVAALINELLPSIFETASVVGIQAVKLAVHRDARGGGVRRNVITEALGILVDNEELVKLGTNQYAPIATGDKE